MRYTTQGVGKGSGGDFYFLNLYLLAKDLLYLLSIIDGAGKVQEPVEMLENLMLICSLYL